jgi:1-deoxy-D-xylulose-5-phosphate reductoisomerase
LELLDGQQIWVVSEPDMRLPIAQAMFYPSLAPRTLGQFRPFDRALEFFLADEERFDALRLAKQAFSASQSEIVRLVAANEAIVESFLQGGLHFWRVLPLLESFMSLSPLKAEPKPFDLPYALRLLKEEKKAALAFLNNQESILGEML